MLRFAIFLVCSSIFLACNTNNVTQDNSLKKYFDENKVQGCFGLMDNGSGQFTIYNLSRFRDSSYSPASTFKIVNSLIGLQTGHITNDSMVIPWDGIKRWNEDWNKDLSMYQAFRVSAVNYYQEVARRIGKDTMQLWLDSLHYGNARIGGAIDSFWLDNSLKVKPDEQLGLVKKLYFNQLPFFKSYQEMVKHAMIQEDNTNYRLAYKTGTGYRENGNISSWMVGWVEENKHPYFFVLNMESTDPKAPLTQFRKKMLQDILVQLGFFKGKR